MNKRTCNLLVFMIGVIMLLLRPYMIYQLTQKSALANDPVKTYNLLQRLVKKKDDHQELIETAATVSQRSRFSFQPPVLQIRTILALASIFAFFSLILQSISYWCIIPQNHRYRLVSCFRI